MEVYRFGPFELDVSARRLRRDGEVLQVPDRHLNILGLLTSSAGQIVSKDALIEAGWQDVAVGDNSLEQAIANLRKALGRQPGGEPYIETLARRGYRFGAPVERGRRRHTDEALDALLAPHRAFVEGRAALETLGRDAVARARGAFEQALRAEPDFPAAHVGMANACVLTFESTRSDAVPDTDALRLALHHAREGCRLDVSSGEAWSALAFVLHRTGAMPQAVAAARKAVTLDPDNWRHHLRLAFVSWGEERLRAAHRVLALCPGLALAYWFAATVFVARQAFEAALGELRAGCASQDAQRRDTTRFSAVGLHLLHGLVLAAEGQDDRALDELMRELEFESDGQLYARECCGNTWYSIGAIHQRNGRDQDARLAFDQALKRVTNHPLAAAAMGRAVDDPVAHAVTLALAGQHDAAARLCADMLAHAEPGPTGWNLVVDPSLNVCAHRDAWAQTLAVLRDRAT